jgi:hypothetical protein
MESPNQFTTDGRSASMSWCRASSGAVPSSLILSSLRMEAIRSSETSVLNRPHGPTAQKATILL